MHDQPLNQQELSPEATEYLDQQIVRALETQPQVVVPADFAWRVVSRAAGEASSFCDVDLLRPGRDADRHFAYPGGVAGPFSSPDGSCSLRTC